MPPRKIKPVELATDLPVRLYRRGGQGTFVYAPDVAVYVATEEYGVVDLSPYVVDFAVQRNVNAVSTFTCTLDNKFSKWDRTIRRMDRIVVFLKRVSWVQVFAGYVTYAPWETVVPSEITIMAECTLKRLVHTYWDPYSAEALEIFPVTDAKSISSPDGGSAASMFKLLTVVGGWSKDQILIQNLPQAWLNRALEVLARARDEEIASEDWQTVRDALVKLFEADGWFQLFPNLDELLGADVDDTSKPADRRGRRSAGHKSGGKKGGKPRRGGGKKKSGSATESAFNVAYYYPGLSALSQALTGKRAWVNDVPLIESVIQLAGASLRDIQSAPNGDFLAFYPDRLGIDGKFPTMAVADIEVIDFKLAVHDQSMVTHYVSIGDFLPQETKSAADYDPFVLAGYVTVEQDEVMELLLGLKKKPTGLGRSILERFGIRPRREDSPHIRNPGWNYTMALHRFQEAWANQWQAMVSFTFMPEIYPGMRIELVDHDLGVYVESVTHQGSRSAGFTTSVVVSTPMRKKAGKWVLLRPEFGAEIFDKDIGETIPQQKAHLTPGQLPG